METFLREAAGELYGRYGNEISSLDILFPSRRARLFFNDALASIAGKPLWQPRYRPIDEVMEEIAGIRQSDSVRLVAELFSIYRQYHDEPFDKFFHWGETLLADFDQIDKYRVDAAMLFVNIADLKQLEGDLGYLTPEKIEIVRQFWRNFDADHPGSGEKQHFVGVWNSLLPIYTGFRQRLNEIGLAYPGMIYRAAAEKMLADRQPEEVSALLPAPERPEELKRVLSRRYAVIGFNALSATEKVLFDYLQRQKVADFFWDYDTYYTEQPEQEAGLFLRENTVRFPAKKSGPKPSHFAEPKEIVAVAAPSDALQAKYVTTFLNDLAAQSGAAPGKETAIVLTDEGLLSPVLYSIPEAVEKINITMGYPLRQTPAYTLLERLIELQQHKKQQGNTTVFYHGDVTGLLGQPAVARAAGETAAVHAGDIVAKRQIYVPAERFADDERLSAIFTPVSGWEALCDYLTEILSLLGSRKTDDPESMQPEFFSLILDRIYQLQNTLRECRLEITDRVLLSLLRKMLQQVRVPYEGEPLEGLQVMGILETRNLDFENVVILSVNDDTFPGNLSASSSFIPHNLRLAYGLPTPQHHEGVYGYYFYRLIQRARRIHLVYSVKTDEKKTGEPSRYIYQLDYESPHRVLHRTMALDIQFPPKPELAVGKDGTVAAALAEFLEGRGERKISPSLFYSYVECPLKFYYQAVARLKESEELDEEVDGAMFGNIFHKAAEIIYGGLKKESDAEEQLKTILKSPSVDQAVDRAIVEEYFKGEKNITPADFGGNLTLVGDIVRRYLKTGLLAHDSTNGEFRVEATEHWVDSPIEISVDGRTETVRLGGKIDRLDVLDDDTLRVVDYKTGARKSDFRGLDALFSPVHAHRNPAALQTLFYSWMLHRETGYEVVPALYFVRFMNQPDYSPLLSDVQTDEKGKKLAVSEVLRVSDYAGGFSALLKEKLTELFDRQTPFVPCEDRRTCTYCPYREICER